MKKTDLLLSIFFVNIGTYLYLLFVGTVNFVEPSTFQWLLSGIGFTIVGSITDVLAMATIIIVIAMLFKGKLNDRAFLYFLVFWFFVLLSFAAKVYVSTELFNLRSSIKPEAFAILSVFISAIYNYLLTLVEDRKKLGTVIVGGDMKVWNELKNIYKYDGSVGVIENVNKLNKFNEKYESKRYIIVDLSAKELDLVMLSLTFAECVAFYLHTGTNVPEIEESKLKKWQEKYEFDVIRYDEFMAISLNK